MNSYVILKIYALESTTPLTEKILNLNEKVNL